MVYILPVCFCSNRNHYTIFIKCTWTASFNCFQILEQSIKHSALELPIYKTNHSILYSNGKCAISSGVRTTFVILQVLQMRAITLHFRFISNASGISEKISCDIHQHFHVQFPNPKLAIVCEINDERCTRASISNYSTETRGCLLYLVLNIMQQNPDDICTFETRALL